MSKVVVLAEKPSVGRDIAKVLHCHKKGNGFFEGDTYIVTWALGHLVTLADPEAYDDKYKSWKLEDLPMLFSSLKLVVIKQSGKQFQAVKTQMNRRDVRQIVIATDAGREGELVARWIIEKAHVKKPLKRLWISSVTDKAIKDGFNKLKDGHEYENLYASAVARSEADWFVGINATRALTCKYNAQLSCGRVQTPTLAMIARREEEIKQFSPRNYYGITAVTKDNISFMWQDQHTNETKSFSKDKIDQILTKIKGKQAKVIGVDKSSKKSYAPQLYDLTALQKEAHNRFGFSAKETLATMQRLYEQHKLLTYPRTDSRYLSTDIIPTLKDRIRACGVGPYSKVAAQALRQPLKGNKSFVDNQRVSDHHAIIPTEQSVSLHALSEKERKIYDLVVKRFLAVLFPPFEYEQTIIRARLADELFIAKGKKVIVQGWKEVYEEHSEEEEHFSEMADQILPSMNKGNSLTMTNLRPTKGETQPPPPFHEGSLLSAMENPKAYMADADKKLIKTIDKTGGLGTVATRADIIEKLFNSFLIEKRGKNIYITSKGKQLLNLVPDDLKSPALTAEWEQKLEMISKGKLSKEAFLIEIKDYTKVFIQEIKKSEQRFRHDNLTGKSCPDCGKNMLEVKGKKGKILVCQDRECGHRKHISKITNARCPNCRKKLHLHGEGEGQIFVCRCGHREKLSTFNERKKREKSKASKKDVHNYLKKQNKQQDEPFNPAMAEALAKLKRQ